MPNCIIQNQFASKKTNSWYTQRVSMMHLGVFIRLFILNNCNIGYIIGYIAFCGFLTVIFFYQILYYWIWYRRPRKGPLRGPRSLPRGANRRPSGAKKGPHCLGRFAAQDLPQSAPLWWGPSAPQRAASRPIYQLTEDTIQYFICNIFIFDL